MTASVIGPLGGGSGGGHGGGGGGGGGAYNNLTGHADTTSETSNSLYARGAGALPSFSYSQYDGTDYSLTQYHGLETGMWLSSITPPFAGSWTLDNTREDEVDRATTGSGLVGTSTATMDTERDYAQVIWTNGAYDSTQSYSSLDTAASNGTFALEAPKPTNVLPLPGYARTDLAIAANLYAAGLLVGVVDDVKSGGGVTVPRGDVVGIASKSDDNAGGNADTSSPSTPDAYTLNLNTREATRTVFVPRQSSTLFVNDYDGATNSSAAGSRLGQLLGQIGNLKPGDIGFEINGHGQVRMTFSENARDLIRKALAMNGLDPGLRSLLEAALGTGGPKNMSAGGPGFIVGDGWGVGSKALIGQPGFWESLIPIWGSGRAALDHLHQGNFGWAGFYGVLAVTDVFLLRSVIQGGAKIIFGSSAKGAGEAMVHITSTEAAGKIAQSGTVVGTKVGVQAVPKAVESLSSLMRMLKTFLSLKKVQVAVEIPADLIGKYFSKPLVIGPFTLWKMWAGHARTLPGILDLVNGVYKGTGGIWRMVLSDYLPDFMIWIIRAVKTQDDSERSRP